MTGKSQTHSPFLDRNWLSALAIVGAVFFAAILGSLHYSGLIGLLGEWQFSRLGFYLPMLSVLAWVGLTALILWLVAKVVLRSRIEDTIDLQRASRRPTLTRNALVVLGFAAGLVALVGAFNLVSLPGPGKTERLLTPTTITPGIEGGVRLKGFKIAGPMARYSEGVFVWKHDVFLVPLLATAAETGKSVRIFAQVTPYEAGTKVPSEFRGILRQSALPRELYPLYSSQGVTIEGRAAVLYRDSFSMALSTLLFIGEAATIAFIALVAAVIIHRRRMRPA